MAMAKTRTQVHNLTRNDLMQGVAKRFLGIASDHGYNCGWYLDRLEVMFSMRLISKYELYVFKNDEPIAGVTLRFDWDRHIALVESQGELFDPDQINQYGTTDSITDTIEAIRKYVSGLFQSCGATRLEVWYSVSRDRAAELGDSRIAQLIDTQPRGKEQQDAIQKELAKINAAKSAKGKNRVSMLGDLPETSFEAW